MYVYIYIYIYTHIYIYIYIYNIYIYIEPSRKPTMKLFRKHNQRPIAGNYLRKIAPPQLFDWALNTPPEREIV